MKLKALLRERGIGTLTVKKRGSAVEPEELRKKVKPSGPHTATVFLTRVAGAPTMLIGALAQPHYWCWTVLSESRWGSAPVGPVRATVAGWPPLVRAA